MKSPKISVLLPAYNHESYIEAAVRSLLSQSEGCLEVLAVDDGSTDRTGQVLDRLAREDQRLRVFHQENRGIAAALNLALREASGEWIASCGSDDIVPPNAYRTMLRHGGSSDIVIGEFSEIGGMGGCTRVRLSFGRDCFSALFAMPAMWNKLIRRGIMTGAEIWFPDVLLCEDLIVLAQIAALRPSYVTVKRDIYHYRNNPAAYCSMTHCRSPAYVLAHIEGRRRVAEIAGAAGAASGMRYVYQTSLPFLAELLLSLKTEGEEAFQAAKEFLLAGENYIDNRLFERVFFVPFEEFLREDYGRYSELISRIPHEEFVLRKFQTGGIGLQFAARCVWAWAQHKLGRVSI